MRYNLIGEFKIENKGKVTEEEFQISKDILGIISKIDKFTFLSFLPKCIFSLKREDLQENEKGGILFNVTGEYLKGRVRICKNIDGLYNLYFFKKTLKDKKVFFKEYKNEFNIRERDLVSTMEFIDEGEENKIEEKIKISLKKGDVCLLDDGFVCIIRNYFSNEKIGVVYDEDDIEPKDFISKERIIKVIRSLSC